MTHKGPAVMFDMVDAQNAQKHWGMNCGPGSLAGVLGISLGMARDHIPEFQRKGHTKETMMEAALESFGIPIVYGRGSFPDYGLVRVLWKGPWWDDPAPFSREYHSHWIGVSSGAVRMIFDINAIASGGWISQKEWESTLVPWLLEGSPATGEWEISESYAIDPDILPPHPVQGIGLSSESSF